MVISRHKSSFPRLGKWRAAPGGPPRRWAARPARRRRPRPAAALGLALCAARRSPPVISGRLAGAGLSPSPFLRLCGRRWVGLWPPARAVLGRARPPPPRARLPPASARCGARVLASLAASGSRSAARGPPRASCGPSPGPSVGARARPGGAPLPRGACSGLACGAAAPRAGALGPLRGPRGARSSPPRGGGRGLVPPAAWVCRCLSFSGIALRRTPVKAKASAQARP